MEIELSFFLFIYLIYIAIFLFYTFFNLYHTIKYGFVSLGMYIITFLYLSLTILALFVSYFYIAQVDWSSSIYFFQSNNSFF
jgi:hypothetical protein